MKPIKVVYDAWIDSFPRHKRGRILYRRSVSRDNTFNHEDRCPLQAHPVPYIAFLGYALYGFS